MDIYLNVFFFLCLMNVFDMKLLILHHVNYTINMEYIKLTHSIIQLANLPGG